MSTYTVFRNERTGAIAAVKEGYCFPAFWLTTLQLGWAWAFARGATDFAWKLLGVAFIAALIAFGFPLIVLVCSLPFAATVGRIANGHLSRPLRQRGYTELQRCEATSVEAALASINPAGAI